MKEADILVTVGIVAIDMGMFPQIARPASQREISLIVRPVERPRNDVLDFEWHVKHDFRSMTILTAMPGAQRDLGVEGIHGVE
jgi:hypothetical protein